MRRRRQYERFRFEYPPGHERVSVGAIPISQLTPDLERPRPPHCCDRRWNGELVGPGELRPGRDHREDPR